MPKSRNLRPPLRPGVLRPVREVLADAVVERRLPATLDLEAASLALAGPLLTQHVMLRAPISDDLIRLVVTNLLATHQGAEVLQVPDSE